MQRKHGVIIGYINFFILNISTFFLTPLMIYVWGTEEFGIYKLVMTLTGFFMLLDFGISNSIIRFVSEYKEKNEKINERKFLGLILMLFGIMVCVLLIGSYLVSFEFHSIYKALSNEQVILAKNLFLLLIFNASILLFSNIFQSILKAYEKYIFLNAFLFFKNLIRFGAVYCLLLKNVNTYTIVAVDIILNAIFLVLIILFVFIKLKIRFQFFKIEKMFISNVFSYSIFIFIEMIAFQFFWSTDLILLGIFSTANAIAVYSIGVFFTSSFESMSGIISGVTMPRIINISSKKNHDEEFFKEIVKIARIKMFILSIPLIGFIFIGKDLITLWVGLEFLDAYYIAVIVMIPQYFSRVQDVLSQVMWAKNRQKQKALISSIAAFINIAITIFLIQEIGIIGAAIGTAIAFTVGYLIGEGSYVHRKLGINIFLLYKKVYSSAVLSFFIIGVFSYLLMIFTNLSWKVLSLKIIIFLMIYSSIIWLLALNKDEKKIIKSFFKFLN
ncbi:oligosaccharide flippase family protein [Planococcus shenhongbingii]|uniref:Oligosaccharide flippase family protein n=1 Tax=Planococcus shenhongbingii TaxID=3058398 RepID=A0ABT8NAI1_9BACL|nr:oligosaccharide flippase family protein [Planococcus sp. N017]MDN7244684.1 oligosaccharide flippase family protein [Planococcus sp. N017]